MGRKKKDAEFSGDHVELDEHEHGEAVDVIETAPPIASIASIAPKKLAPAPPKTFRVMMKSRMFSSGHDVWLNQGDIVSESTHDVATMKLQGVLLEEI